MIDTRLEKLHSARRWLRPAGLFAFVLALATPALAQQPTPSPTPPAPPKVAPQPEAPQAEPSATKGLKGLDKLPQTADEKSRLLSNLYAHLATAENEEAAKKVSQTIERLWFHYGSDTVSLMMQRANKALAAKDSALALKFLDYAVQLAPDYAEVFNRRAFVHYSQGNYQAAVGDLRRALALEPNHYKALDGLAQIWRQTGNKKAALTVLRQLLEVHPFWSGAKQAVDELTREVDGQGI